MADTVSMALEALVRKAQMEQDVDVLREGVRVLSEALMELEVTEHVGAKGMSARRSGPGSAMATGSGSGTRG